MIEIFACVVDHDKEDSIEGREELKRAKNHESMYRALCDVNFLIDQVGRKNFDIEQLVREFISDNDNYLYVEESEGFIKRPYHRNEVKNEEVIAYHIKNILRPLIEIGIIED